MLVFYLLENEYCKKGWDNKNPAANKEVDLHLVGKTSTKGCKQVNLSPHSSYTVSNIHANQPNQLKLLMQINPFHTTCAVHQFYRFKIVSKLLKGSLLKMLPHLKRRRHRDFLFHSQLSVYCLEPNPKTIWQTQKSFGNKRRKKNESSIRLRDRKTREPKD